MQTPARRRAGSVKTHSKAEEYDSPAPPSCCIGRLFLLEYGILFGLQLFCLGLDLIIWVVAAYSVYVSSSSPRAQFLLQLGSCSWHFTSAVLTVRENLAELQRFASSLGCTYYFFCPPSFCLFSSIDVQLGTSTASFRLHNFKYNLLTHPPSHLGSRLFVIGAFFINTIGTSP